MIAPLSVIEADADTGGDCEAGILVVTDAE